MRNILKTIPWILTVILYSPVFYMLYKRRWEDVDYTHAYFILPVSLFIVFLKRKKIKELIKSTPYSSQPKAYYSSLTIMIISLLMFIFGCRKGYFFIQTFSLIPLLLGMTYYLYGWKVTRLLLFPILYLLLLVPPPLGILDSITLPMRYGSSVVNALLLKGLNYPITREGLLLTMGGHEIFMGAPCSGFRSLITMFSLGLVYVYFNKGRFSKNLLLIFSIIPLALIGNFIRIFVLCLITYYFGEEAGQGFFHNFSGIVIFIITILGLIGVETLMGTKTEQK